MKVKEMMNLLRNFPPEDDVIACTDEELFSISEQSMRSSELVTTVAGEIVEKEAWTFDEDGPIAEVRSVLLIDLEV